MKSNDSPKVLDFVREDLVNYKAAAESSKTCDELSEKMIAKYPKLGCVDNLKMGAKVFKGEMEWELKSPYPAIGNHVLVEFGKDFQFDLNFIDNQQMRFTGTTAANKNLAELVRYTAVEVSPNVYMVYWSEASTKANVVHVQNWNTHEVYTNIANPDGSFIHLKGTLKIKD